ncbi:uncharacterized protein Z520_09544 [Fonsecaea multimorphosa CBS 102226]|uniref:Uncharacterized protein n=1 Tax=Fonsecaea multimorphosa CBS 102226 TaxID=1442371 RepID=A0A0D2JWG8_9EURO|nr:uncharacterized protein Z520_09544 [Fonsecaea multimorphosa CBS 102226]KIX94854.1 hypothetical protein Z520_09544 [Fonsecaea multimorphosa CBS 102226]OAL20431.1 hypothetical protein AYO22_08925 [Fonsecaea multimorphosa]
MSSTAFAAFWRTDLVRECFLSHVQKDDLQSLRLVSKALADDVAPTLFKSLEIHFRTNTFSRRSRMSALNRIGYHVRRLSFIMPHHSDTFLPPLLIPGTLEEVTFMYEPRINNSRPHSSSSSSSSSSSTSKFGSWEMNDLLVKQYPPLFHAATNVDSFFHAVSSMPRLQHLHISCPNQPAGQRYRKDIVDYALISLRLAMEAAKPSQLVSLTLAPIHPAAVFYLRPHLSIGTSPASFRVWKGIKSLEIEMDSFEYGRNQPSDHLKILHSYLQTFHALEHFKFQWLGNKGPFPLALHIEPCTSRPTSLDCSKACPDASTRSSCRPLRFRHLKSMRLSNASLDAIQASGFIMSHRKALHEFHFDLCHLRSGTWDDALAPLTRIVGNDSWKQKQEEVMDVPIMLSPVNEKTGMECVQDHLWDDVLRKSKGLQTLRKVSLRTKELLPEQVRRLLKNARLAWH